MNYYYYYFFFVFGLQACLLLVAAASSSSSSNIFLSDVLKDQRYAGRNLLQTKRKCQQSFEFANYTILTSKCKGPDYPKNQCCSALGDFACQYAQLINDASYDCSSIMLTYIYQHTGYPQGLFSSECRENIPCSVDSPTSSPIADANAATVDDIALLFIPQTLIFVFTFLSLHFCHN
ncbi:hypothetical protein IHE45_16G089600 [Dioscorea alata]|uniref:Uncharacterized protein n=1 Tax=Dioscorea alata TaxID=55571 RepID=A0ACB7UJ63_DIOAL|nr:hypothetical protein IHE45_16G089600 [Dioscorea alata]